MNHFLLGRWYASLLLKITQFEPLMFAFHGIWTWVVAQQSIKFLPKFESLSSEIPLPRRNHSDSQVFKLRFNIWSFLSQNLRFFKKTSWSWKYLFRFYIWIPTLCCWPFKILREHIFFHFFFALALFLFLLTLCQPSKLCSYEVPRSCRPPLFRN